MMLTPLVTPTTRHLAQRNDELEKLAATYREAILEAMVTLEDGARALDTGAVSAAHEILWKALS